MNDPTRGGPAQPVGRGKVLQLSLNEVESLCIKAARGAGMSWGLAEEAGYAAGWLVSRGYDGALMLARHLHTVDGKPWQDICPVVSPGEWRTMRAVQVLCPIALGATLSDHLGVDGALLDGPGLRVVEVNSPVLVLPFLALALDALQKTICVCHKHDVVRIFADGSIGGDISMLLDVECGSLFIAVEQQIATVEQQVITVEQQITTVEKQTADCDPKVPANRSVPVPVSSEAATFLHELAMRTTVPASESSRANAGAAGSEND